MIRKYSDYSIAVISCSENGEYINSVSFNSCTNTQHRQNIFYFSSSYPLIFILRGWHFYGLNHTAFNACNYCDCFEGCCCCCYCYLFPLELRWFGDPIIVIVAAVAEAVAAVLGFCLLTASLG